MGLSYTKEVGKSGKLGLWHITESVEELLKMREVSKEDLSVLKSFTYDNRKKEWLVSRILAQEISGRKDVQIIYDENNKPFLKGSEKHISLSHSHDFLAVIIDDKETGIDIELIKPNVLKIKEKFMSMEELEALGKDNVAEKLTLYWCVKESLYKYYGKKKLTFKENLIVEPFEYLGKGIIFAHIHHKTMKKKFELHYEKIPAPADKSAEGKDYMLSYIIND